MTKASATFFEVRSIVDNIGFLPSNGGGRTHCLKRTFSFRHSHLQFMYIHTKREEWGNGDGVVT